MSESNYILPPFDPTAYPTLSGSQLYQLVSGLQPQSDVGFTFTTIDSGVNPDVPDGGTYPALRRFIWRRVSATGVSAYMWSDNGTNDPVYQKWVSINVSAIGVGTIIGDMIADNTIPYNKIISLTWEQISNPPTFIEAGDAAGGDLSGTYPDPSVAAGAVTTAKLADGALSADVAGRAKMADLFLTFSKIAPNAVGLTLLRTNAGATAVEWFVNTITQLANPAGGQSLNFIRVNAGGTAFEYITPEDAGIALNTDITFTTTPVAASTIGAGGVFANEAHGLGAVPAFVYPVLVCTTGDLGYSIGDEIPAIGVEVASGGGNGMTIYGCASATNVFVVVRAASSGWLISHKTTGVATLIDTGDWSLKIYARL